MHIRHKGNLSNFTIDFALFALFDSHPTWGNSIDPLTLTNNSPSRLPKIPPTRRWRTAVPRRWIRRRGRGLGVKGWEAFGWRDWPLPRDEKRPLPRVLGGLSNHPPVTLPKTTSKSPLKMRGFSNCGISKTSIPGVYVQGLLLVVSGRVLHLKRTFLNPKKLMAGWRWVSGFQGGFVWFFRCQPLSFAMVIVFVL